MNAYDGCIPVTVYMVQEYVGVCIFGKWVNINGFSDKEKAEALMWLLEHETKHKSKKTMKTEENKRMLALSCIAADLKAENIELAQRVQQLVDDYNDVARQLNGKETHKDEDPSKLLLGNMQKMRDHCDKLEKENGELERFAKAIHSFVKDKKLYMANGANCPYYQDGHHVFSTFCLECKSCLGIIEGLGVICANKLVEARVFSPENE